MIEKYHLPWKQYLDLDSKEAITLSVESYPSNFLLDLQGKIIAKNNRPFGLKTFLAENLF